MAISVDDEASNLLIDAAEFFAATFAVADPRAWERLLIYIPLDVLLDIAKERELMKANGSNRI